jgi:hypothetical protein
VRTRTGRISGVSGATLLALILLALPVAAQVDVTGTWAMSVSTDQGVTSPTMTLEQDGDTISGTYSSEALGENRVRGTVNGSNVTISFAADVQGQSIPVTYRGTIDNGGEMAGSLDIADGMLTGTFTAKRSEN